MFRYTYIVLLVSLTAGIQAAGDPTRCLYLPPSWSDRVIYYNSFERGFDQPDINLITARTTGEKGDGADGFAGKGYRAANQYEKKQVLALSSAELTVRKPLTVMKWFRLDASMKEDSCFQLLNLHGRGWISSFVRGKGEWCALTQPTCISQVYNFPGMSNHHNSWGGRTWFEPGTWHHVAITVAGGSEVSIYWDGTLRETISLKGRKFADGDVSAIDLDPGWLYFPMTIDEVILADRALTAEEIADYMRGARALREVGFPVGS